MRRKKWSEGEEIGVVVKTKVEMQVLIKEKKANVVEEEKTSRRM